MMKKTLTGILSGVMATLLAVSLVLAAYYAYITVTESLGNDYENLAMNVTLDTDYLVAQNYISATGLDTRVSDSSYNVQPHMLADDRLLFVGDVVADSENQFIFWTGQSLIDQFQVIAGHGGYVTINDTADLEPGTIYAFGIVGLFDMSGGGNRTVIRKDGACSLNASVAYNLTWSVVGGSTITAVNMTSGYHTVMIYNDSFTMWMEVDSINVGNATASAVPNTANDWHLFENDVCPYVSYYGEWVV